MRKVSVRMITQVAMLVALDIIITRLLSINTPNLRIGFGFVPIAVCGYLYGPLWAGLAAGISDVLGIFILNTTGATFFPGITLTAVLTGISMGFFLDRRKNPRMVQTTCAAAINCFILSLLLQTYWLSVLLGYGYMVLLPGRIAQSCIMFAIQFVTLPLIVKSTDTISKRFPGLDQPHADNSH